MNEPMATLVGADSSMVEALAEIARLYAGPDVHGPLALDVPETLWERVVGGADARWNWDEVHDGRLGWGHEWRVALGPHICMMRGIRAVPSTTDLLGVGAMGLVANSDELVDYILIAVAPPQAPPNSGELYRTLRNDGIPAHDALIVVTHTA
jgi:hypothetical protein